MSGHEDMTTKKRVEACSCAKKLGYYGTNCEATIVAVFLCFQQIGDPPKKMGFLGANIYFKVKNAVILRNHPIFFRNKSMWKEVALIPGDGHDAMARCFAAAAPPSTPGPQCDDNAMTADSADHLDPLV